MKPVTRLGDLRYRAAILKAYLFQEIYYTKPDKDFIGVLTRWDEETRKEISQLEAESTNSEEVKP
jgi:hypothetical protein